MELIEESTELNAEEAVMAPPNGSTKPAPPHVPPRIDPDMYQADVPDWCPPKEGFIHIISTSTNPIPHQNRYLLQNLSRTSLTLGCIAKVSTRLRTTPVLKYKVQL